MASQFLNTIKYGLLTVVAFFGPKIITDSGSWVGNMEKQWEMPPASTPSGSSRPMIPPKEKKSRSYSEDEVDPKKDQWGFMGGNRKTPNRSGEEQIIAQRPESDWRTVITPIDEIFRFDHYPAWMVQRWSRVDTVQAVYPLRGYRVVVLTGTDENDLSGVLTCYFDEWAMQRIDFSGRTGNFSKILKYLSTHYGLQYHQNSTPNYYIYESVPLRKGEKNQMLVTPAPVFFADQKKDSFAVRIVLFRPE